MEKAEKTLTVSDLVKLLDGTVMTGAEGLDKPVRGMYAGDLLSWVMGRAKEGNAWVTIQGHLNIVAVASLVGVSCVVVAEGAEAEPDTLEKARDEGIPVIRTTKNAFEVIKAYVLAQEAGA